MFVLSIRRLSEEDNVLSYLAGEGLGKGQQVLLFCPSKLNCVQICSVLMETLCPLISNVATRGAPHHKAEAHVELQLEVEGVAGGGTDIKSGARLPIIQPSNSTSASTSITALTTTPAPTTAQTAESYMDNSRVFATHQRFQFHVSENNSDSAKGSSDYSSFSKDGNNTRNNNSSSSSSGSSSSNSSSSSSSSSNNNSNNNNNNKIALRNKILRDRLQCVTQILDLNPQANPSLLAFIACGLAYHHAGLSLQERGAVEQAFKSGTTSCPPTALIFPSLPLHDLKCLVVHTCYNFISKGLHVVYYTYGT